MSWYYQPLFSTGDQGLQASTRAPARYPVFALREVTFAAWTLAAFTIAALAGMLIRQVVPAIVATFAVYAASPSRPAQLLREHYLTPLITHSLNLPGTGWIIGQWWTKGGRFAFSAPPGRDNLFHHCCRYVGAVVKGGAGTTETVPQCTWPRPATRCGPATSLPAGSGRSS